jgi:thiol-disulfide isomerase/thioredoxin
MEVATALFSTDGGDSMTASPKKGFLFGLGAGMASVLILLQVWGNYLERSENEKAQPRILRPFTQAQPRPSFENFPHPWFSQALGSAASSWKLAPLEGAPVTLAQFKGKVLFLNFWSTSCLPCIEEMPGIAKLYKSLKDERIAFVAVTGEGRLRVTSFLKENDLGVPVYLSDEEPPKDLPSPGIPTTFILDNNGTAVFMHAGPLNWDDNNARDYLHNLAERAPTPN